MTADRKERKQILIVTGEASGDTHAAKLVAALRRAAPDAEFEFFGATGSALRCAGVESVIDSDDFSIVGLPEIARALPMFWAAFKKLKNAAVERRADAAILVDFPDFNLKLAKSLSKRGVKIVYYISPQIWAWRQYRIRTIKKYVDLMLTILPFEKDWYASRGFTRVEYIGNPTIREIRSEKTKAEFCDAHNLNADQPIIALLAGSRHKEITRILPVLLETAAIMHRRMPQIQFVIPLAAGRKKAEVEAAAAEAEARGCKLPNDILTVQGETHEALNAADAAAVTSGTATLETGIIGTPMAIVYKTSPLNYKLLRPLISVEHFGLINLIAGERVAREMIQDDFTPELLGEELFSLLEPARNRQMRERLSAVTKSLGAGGAADAAAAAILNLLRENET